MTAKNSKNRNSKSKTPFSNEDLRPSEILKRRRNQEREQCKKESLERDAEITAKANQHIEALQKYINEPEEIEAYLILNREAEYLSIAVYEVHFNNCLEAEFLFYKIKTLRSDENYRIALNSVLNISTPEQKSDLELFEKTTNPKPFLSLSILANHLRRERQRVEAFGETIGIVYESGWSKETGRRKLAPIDGTGDLDETVTNRTLFSWKRVEKFLPTLPDEVARLEYLINLRARFNRMSESARKDMNPEENFSRNASAEIEQLGSLMLLGQMAKKQKPVVEVSNFERKRIIDAAVRLSETRDRWNELDLIEEIVISKTKFYTLKKSFGWQKIQMLRDEVQAVIREKNK